MTPRRGVASSACTRPGPPGHCTSLSISAPAMLNAAADSRRHQPPCLQGQYKWLTSFALVQYWRVSPPPGQRTSRSASARHANRGGGQPAPPACLLQGQRKGMSAHCMCEYASKAVGEQLLRANALPALGGGSTIGDALLDSGASTARHIRKAGRMQRSPCGCGISSRSRGCHPAVDLSELPAVVDDQQLGRRAGLL